MAEVAQAMQIEAEAAVCGDWSTRLLRCFQGGRQGGGLLSKKKRVTRGASKRAKQLFNSPARASASSGGLFSLLERCLELKEKKDL
jgi:hypothetical protein